MAERSIQALDGAVSANDLDTLAAAHAEAGDFEAAARIAREGLASLEARGAPAADLRAFGARVAAFEAGTAVRY